MTPGRFWPRDEALLGSVVDWSVNRIVEGQDPLTAARSADALLEEVGQTVTSAGIGGVEALRLFTEVLMPATRAQDEPMNLAYVAAAPTEAALVFDLAVSAAGIFAGTWESGAGAIAAENQALAWITSLMDCEILEVVGDERGRTTGEALSAAVADLSCGSAS